MRQRDIRILQMVAENLERGQWTIIEDIIPSPAEQSGLSAVTLDGRKSPNRLLRGLWLITYNTRLLDFYEAGWTFLRPDHAFVDRYGRTGLMYRLTNK